MKPKYILGIAVLLILSGRAHPYTFVQVGVAGDIIVLDGRVIFAQFGGSLTALDLATGKVLERKTDAIYAGRLLLTNQGLLNAGFENVRLLDSKTLETIWSRGPETSWTNGRVTVAGDRAVFINEMDSIHCVDLITGRELWAQTIGPVNMSVAVERGRVAVWLSSGTAAVQVYDMETGSPLTTITRTPELVFTEMFFDGERAYIEAAVPDYKRRKDDSAYYGQHLVSPRLLVYDLSGNKVEEHPITREMRSAGPIYGESLLEAAGMVFGPDHRARPGHLPPKTAEAGAMEAANERLRGRLDYQAFEFALTTGTLRLISIHDPAHREFAYLERAGADGPRWRVYAPSLKSSSETSGEIVGAAEAGDALIYGTNTGQVECLDAATGASRWLYVFPASRETMSYSAHGMPPTYTERAAIFKRERDERVRAAHGAVALDAGLTSPALLATDLVALLAAAPATPVIIDPKPHNAFPMRLAPLTLSWAGAVIPALGLAAYARLRRRRPISPGRGIEVALVLSLITWLAMMFYGRYSWSCAVALRVSLAACIGFGFVQVVRLFREGRSGPALVSAAFLGFLLYNLLMILIP